MNYKFFILLIFVSTSELAANEHVFKLLKDHYSSSFEVANEDINLEILRMHDFKNSWLDHELKIDTNYDEIKCGTQHAWLKILDNGRLVHKMPITLNLAVFKDVWIAEQTIKRNQPLEYGMLRRNRKEIKKNYSKYIFNDLDFSGKTQIARKMDEGMVLTRQMLSSVPDVKRGDKINVNVISKNFSIRMAGNAKQNGSVGEEIFVVLNTTGKRLKGKIQSSNLIVVRN